MHVIFGKQEQSEDGLADSHDDTLITLAFPYVLFGERLAETTVLVRMHFLSSAVSWIGENSLSSDRQRLPLLAALETQVQQDLFLSSFGSLMPLAVAEIHNIQNTWCGGT